MIRLTYYFLFIWCVGLLVPFVGSAQEQFPDDVTETLSAFQQYKEVVVPTEVNVPTVLEVPFTEGVRDERRSTVFNVTTQAFEPHIILQDSPEGKPFSIVAAANNQVLTRSQRLIDGQSSTALDFALEENVSNEALLTITSNQELTATGLTLTLDAFVALPTHIEIRAGETLVVAKQPLRSRTVRFLETTASVWLITLFYSQPLRIGEFDLIQETEASIQTRRVRFLTQPENEYRLYFGADRSVRVAAGEMPNLRDDEDVMLVSAGGVLNNPFYKESDVDDDGVPDIRDNCVRTKNPRQLDENGNGRGDACDDFDKDGHSNALDNCPNVPNRDQRDEDGDGIGDVCDTEESRLTERYVWLPWAGMGFAALVLVILFVQTFRAMKDETSSRVSTQEEKKSSSVDGVR